MKRLLSVILFCTMFLSACGVNNVSYEPSEHKNNSAVTTGDYFNVSDTVIEVPNAEANDELSNEYSVIPIVRNDVPMVDASYDYLTLEEALVEFATDIVVAQYVGEKPFGRTLTEFEFVVADRVLGSAADRIFVYADNSINATVYGEDAAFKFEPGDIVFTSGTNYLLPLIAITSPQAKTHEDGYTFIRNIVINLDDVSRSTMYNEPLTRHSTDLDVQSSKTRREMGQAIVSYVDAITVDNEPSHAFIKSNDIEDIVNSSPYVFVVEIVEPLRLSSEQVNTDWTSTDLYYIDVIQILKGDVDQSWPELVIFNADTVSLGEQYIVAVEPIGEGSSWYQFTSRNSLFKMDKLEEIQEITE